MLTASLMTSFQARAATSPKAEVARVSICLTTAWGMSRKDLGGSIFLAMETL